MVTERLYGGIALAQVLANAHAAVLDWMRLQEQVHPESVDGWLLAQQLGEARAAVAAPADDRVPSDGCADPHAHGYRVGYARAQADAAPCSRDHAPPEFAAWQAAVREYEAAEAAWESTPRRTDARHAASLKAQAACGRLVTALAALRAAVARDGGVRG